MKQKTPKDAGQAAVEFALALIVFIPILFVIIDFGWIAYQRVSFEYGYMHSGSAISASDIGNSDPLDADPVTSAYGYDEVMPPLKKELLNNATGIIKDNLDFTKAEAYLRDVEEETNIPSIIAGETKEAFNRTRYMDLKAEIIYTIYPLTPIGGLFFKPEDISITKELVRTKVVGSQQRAE